MRRIIFKQLKIFNTIVSLNTVNMVYNFSGKQVSAEMLFYDKTMLKHVAIFRKRMIMYSNTNIPFMNMTAVFPSRVAFSKLPSVAFIAVLKAVSAIRVHSMSVFHAFSKIKRLFFTCLDVTARTITYSQNNVLVTRIC